MQEFIDHMRDVGCEPAPHVTIQDDDIPHYYDVEGDKRNTKKASYCLKVEPDGFACGWVCSHRDGETYAWHSKAKRGISQEERDEHKRRIAERKRQQLAERERLAKEASDKAKSIWRDADRTGSTPYLDRKRMGLNGARVYRDMVVVPMYKDGAIIGLQYISDDAKIFSKDVEKKGSYYAIQGNPDKSTLRVCEGFATGAAIKDAFPDDWVIIAWDAGNLKDVCKRFARDYPDSKIIVCADNDQWRVNKRSGELENIGLDKAQQAAVAIGGAPVFYPPFDNDDPERRTDWWDYWDAFGADGVRDSMVEHVAPVAVETPLDDTTDVVIDAPSHLDDIRPLGIDKEGNFYFFPKCSGVIVKMSASSLSRSTGLLSLVPNWNFWELHYDVDGKGADSAIIKAATAHLFSECYSKGIFYADGRRGVGVWRDATHGVIVNTGNRILGNGVDCEPSEFRGSVVYENDRAVINLDHEPISQTEARGIVNLINSLSWKRSEYADLLAGWLVCAGVGGALNWRPHIWLTGEAGSGKSYTMDDIIKALISDMGVMYEGGTTYAKIKNAIGNSCRPLVMDEAESETQKARATMKDILEYFRKASSGGKIGNAFEEYTVMSPACFAGINPSVDANADKSRITLIELGTNKSSTSEKDFLNIVKSRTELFTKGLNHRLFKFAFENVNTLIDNIAIFRSACIAMGASPRQSDQLSALAGGAHLLQSYGAVVDFDTALAWLNARSWDWYLSVIEENDSELLVSRIMTSQIDYDSLGMMRRGTVGELIELVVDGGEQSRDANRGLCAYGLKVIGDDLMIANKSHRLAKLLNDTAWVPWARTLGDFPCSGNNGNKAVYFMAGYSSKVKSIPLDIALGKVSIVEEIPLEDEYGSDFA